MWREFAGMVHDTIPENVLQIAMYELQKEKGRLLVVVEDPSLPKLVELSPIIKKMMKKELHAPLIISKFFIETSLDSFPLEFLHIQSAYENLYVKSELIEGLKFNKSEVRLQMEREVKSKMLLTRITALENLDQSKNLYHLLDASVHALIPVMKGFLFLADKKIPFSYHELFENCEVLLQEDLSIFKRALTVYEEKPAKDNLLTFFQNTQTN
jgi:hypothetical protein